MKISSDPSLLQCLMVESYAESVVLTFFMWAQQFNIAKAFLTGDGRAKSFKVGLLEALSRSRFDLHVYEQDEHNHLTNST
ncbi:MAG TPA: hypothetical protein VGM27_00545 [Acidobacteriaceae bacterium]|jgi:hypothetical protein